MNKAAKSKISIDISKEDLAFVKLLAHRADISVSEWVRGAILRAIPAEMKESRREPAFIEVEMSDADSAPGFPTIPLPPDVRQETIEALETKQRADREVQAEALKERAQSSTAPHACVHLRRKAPTTFTLAQCEGTCAHSSQQGRPCFWASAVASNCSLFQTRQEHLRRST